MSLNCPFSLSALVGCVGKRREVRDEVLREERGSLSRSDVERPPQRMDLVVDRGRRLLRVEPGRLVALERGGRYVDRESPEGAHRLEVRADLPGGRAALVLHVNEERVRELVHRHVLGRGPGEALRARFLEPLPELLPGRDRCPRGRTAPSGSPRRSVQGSATPRCGGVQPRDHRPGHRTTQQVERSQVGGTPLALGIENPGRTVVRIENPCRPPGHSEALRVDECASGALERSQHLGGPRVVIRRHGLPEGLRRRKVDRRPSGLLVVAHGSPPTRKIDDFADGAKCHPGVGRQRALRDIQSGSPRRTRDQLEVVGSQACHSSLDWRRLVSVSSRALARVVRVG